MTQASHEEFEKMIQGEFRVPVNPFVSRSPTGYKHGHLNAYFKVYRLTREMQAERVEQLKDNLWEIVSNVAKRKSNADINSLCKQICIDLRAYLDDLK